MAAGFIALTAVAFLLIYPLSSDENVRAILPVEATIDRRCFVL